MTTSRLQGNARGAPPQDASGARHAGDGGAAAGAGPVPLAALFDVLAAPLAVQERVAALGRALVPSLADCCVVELADWGALRVALVYGDRALAGRRPSEGARFAGSRRVLQSGRPELYGAAGRGLRLGVEAGALRGLPARSGLALPLAARGHALGVLTLLAGERRDPYGPAELAAARQIAEWAATAIDDAWLHEAEHTARVAAEEVVESTSLLYAFTAGLAQALTPRDVAQVVTSLGCAVVGARAAWVSALDETGEELELLAAGGFAASFVAAHRRLARDRAFGREAVRDGSARWLGSAEACADEGPELAAALEASGGRALALVPMISFGEPIGAIAFSFATPQRFAEAKRSQVTAVVRQATEALARARLFAAERAARAEAERAARQRAALQALTAHLSSAATVNEVAQILVEEGKHALGAAAGWVSVLAEDGGTLELRAQSGYDAAFVAAYRRVPLDSGLAVARAVREGASRWFATVRGAQAEHPELAAAQAATGAEAVAIVPLSARGATFGFFALRFSEPREFPEAERALLTTLASQAAQAMERARLYEAEHTVAETLQRSLLPERLPPLEGAEAAVRYRAAAQHAEAGGDWYDVAQLRDGRIALAVGDVVGHGAAAAAAMGQLRSALRAYTLAGSGPAGALRRLGAYAEDVPGALAATAACVLIDPATGLARFARAGHPPPLLVPRAGRPRYLAAAHGAGPPLCCEELERLRDGRVRLRPGDVLLLYSDGAVERRGESIERGLERLAAAAAAAAPAGPAALCDAVLARLFESAPPRDDVVLLALCLAPLPAAQAPLRLRLPAEPEALGRVRLAVRRWLTDAGADPETVEAATLACHEAATNVVEHAYRGRRAGALEVELASDGAALELRVRDEGRWRPDARGADERGRGLVLMRGLMDEVDVRTGPRGTVVLLRTALRR